jgi:hypothetical protein
MGNKMFLDRLPVNGADILKIVIDPQGRIFSNKGS